MLFQCIAIFFGMMLLDYCWAYYVLSIEARAPFAAALWSAGIFAVSSTTTIVYVNNHYTIFAAIAGAFLGTYLSVLREAKKKDKQ
jgi:hypothetical protein